VSAIALAVVVALAVAVFIVRARVRWRLLAAARPVDRREGRGERVQREISHVFSQSKLLRKLGPGLMHAAIFWGFLVLLPTIAEAAISIVDREAGLPLLGDAAWFGRIVDLFAGVVIVGVAAAFYIRKIERPDRFRGSHLGEADRILLLILGIVVSLLAWNATRIELGLVEHPEAMSIANVLAGALGGVSAGTLEVAERVLVWTHLLLILGFLAFLPGSKHLHIFTAAPNVYLAKNGPSGRLEPLRIDLEAAEADLRFGAGVASDLSRKQVLDVFTCTECGRCQEVCPAWATGKPLSPKLLVMDLRDHVVAEAPRILAAARGAEVELQPLVPNAVTDEVVWDCVTCGACVNECPVDIEHVDTIVDLRRHLVMAESRFPSEAGALLRGTEGPAQNPWAQPASARTEWADGLEVRVLRPGDPAPEILFWVGCAGAFDERARETTRATARLLAAAGVDFAILGPREACTGDPARRMGHEYLFQMLAEQNVARLDESGVRTIVASCPHCFNTLANEYPDYGGRYEVLHHTQLLARLVAEGRLDPDATAGSVTYHDPCYLSRHNDVIGAPRSVLAGVTTDRREMPRHRDRTFCCGAGGARMWMEETRGTPINEARFEEARATGAETVAVACPYCLVMLDDAAKAADDRPPRVADVAVLLEESLRE
jgi:Fe-S oxidoreductase